MGGWVHKGWNLNLWCLDFLEEKFEFFLWLINLNEKLRKSILSSFQILVEQSNTSGNRRTGSTSTSLRYESRNSCKLICENQTWQESSIVLYFFTSWLSQGNLFAILKWWKNKKVKLDTQHIGKMWNLETYNSKLTCFMKFWVRNW